MSDDPLQGTFLINMMITFFKINIVYKEWNEEGEKSL